MTENEAIEELKYDCNEIGKAIPCDTSWGESFENAYAMAINALEEVQQYRQIGKIGTCRNAVEICKAMIERGIDQDNIAEYIKFEDNLVQRGYDLKKLIEIDGEQYVIKDIFLRMLKPEELKLMQGFPDDYIIDRDIAGKTYPIVERVARIGNSVVPVMAEALVSANCSDLRIGERTPNMRIEAEQTGQLRFA